MKRLIRMTMLMLFGALCIVAAGTLGVIVVMFDSLNELSKIR